MQNNTINKIINSAAIIWALAAGYFAFTDFQISLFVVNQNSAWAKYLQDFGEVPGLIVLYFGAIIFLASYKSDYKLKYYSFSVFIFIAAVYLSERISELLYQGISDNYNIINQYKFYIYLIFIILNFFFYLILKRFNYSEQIKSFSKVSVLLGLFGYLFLIQPIKFLWGRVRFRDIDALYSYFTPWFLPNGINGNQSFPSGHAATALMLLPLLILTANKNIAVKYFLLTVIIFWGLVVGLSRVVIGAHYVSDVLFGAFIIVTVFLLIIKFTQNNFIIEGK